MLLATRAAPDQLPVPEIINLLTTEMIIAKYGFTFNRCLVRLLSSPPSMEQQQAVKEEKEILLIKNGDEYQIGFKNKEGQYVQKIIDTDLESQFIAQISGYSFDGKLCLADELRVAANQIIGWYDNSILPSGDLQQMIQDCYNRAQNARGKKLAMAIGATGAGKSTLVNTLSGCIYTGTRLKIKLHPDSKPEIARTRGKFNHSTTVYTEAFDISKNEEQKAIADFPGLFDNRDMQKIITGALSTEMTIKNAAECAELILVIDLGALTTQQGSPFVETLATVGQLLDIKEVLKLQQQEGGHSELTPRRSPILFVLTKVAQEDDPKQINEVINQMYDTVSADIKNLESTGRIRNLSIEEQDNLQKLSNILPYLTLMKNYPESIFLANPCDVEKNKLIFEAIGEAGAIPTHLFIFQNKYNNVVKEFNGMLTAIIGNATAQLHEINDLTKSIATNQQQICKNKRKIFIIESKDLPTRQDENLKEMNDLLLEIKKIQAEIDDYLKQKAILDSDEALLYTTLEVEQSVVFRRNAMNKTLTYTGIPIKETKCYLTKNKERTAVIPRDHRKCSVIAITSPELFNAENPDLEHLLKECSTAYILVKNSKDNYSVYYADRARKFCSKISGNTTLDPWLSALEIESFTSRGQAIRNKEMLEKILLLTEDEGVFLDEHFDDDRKTYSVNYRIGASWHVARLASAAATLITAGLTTSGFMQKAAIVVEQSATKTLVSSASLAAARASEESAQAAALAAVTAAKAAAMASTDKAIKDAIVIITGAALPIEPASATLFGTIAGFVSQMTIGKATKAAKKVAEETFKQSTQAILAKVAADENLLDKEQLMAMVTSKLADAVSAIKTEAITTLLTFFIAVGQNTSVNASVEIYIAKKNEPNNAAALKVLNQDLAYAQQRYFDVQEKIKKCEQEKNEIEEELEFLKTPQESKEEKLKKIREDKEKLLALYHEDSQKLATRIRQEEHKLILLKKEIDRQQDFFKTLLTVTQQLNSRSSSKMFDLDFSGFETAYSAYCSIPSQSSTQDAQVSFLFSTAAAAAVSLPPPSITAEGAPPSELVMN